MDKILWWKRQVGNPPYPSSIIRCWNLTRWNLGFIWSWRVVHDLQTLKTVCEIHRILWSLRSSLRCLFVLILNMAFSQAELQLVMVAFGVLKLKLMFLKLMMVFGIFSRTSNDARNLKIGGWKATMPGLSDETEPKWLAGASCFLFFPSLTGMPW